MTKEETGISKKILRRNVHKKLPFRIHFLLQRRLRHQNIKTRTEVYAYSYLVLLNRIVFAVVGRDTRRKKTTVRAATTTTTTNIRKEINDDNNDTMHDIDDDKNKISLITSTS